MEQIVNLNVGIFGHVDSGKTSLVKTLSTELSTAALDKNPQSQQRQITLDLGFSAFFLPAENDEKIQVTLVDCPGHASLIKTVIGGGHIIDLVMLVVDVTKGVQQQTIECLVLCEMMQKSVIVVLNKVDLLRANGSQKKIDELISTMKANFNILHNSSFVPISTVTNVGIEQQLIPTIRLERKKNLQQEEQQNHQEDQFLMAIDHCFQLKGKGNVITGTVLKGMVKVNDTVEIVSYHKTPIKIKSLQMFHQSVTCAKQGDRIGCRVLTSTDLSQLERGLVCSQKNPVESLTRAIMKVTSRVTFFRDLISSNRKFHISIGHSTVLANVIFFTFVEGDSVAEYLPELKDDTENAYALLLFETEILCPEQALVIGSRLDFLQKDKKNTCRLGFYGNLAFQHENAEWWSHFQICKRKEREGVVGHINPDKREVIAQNLFKKQTDLSYFVGLKVFFPRTNDVVTIDSAFGKSGKVKVTFPDHGSNFNQLEIGDKIMLRFVKYISILSALDKIQMKKDRLMKNNSVASTKCKKKKKIIQHDFLYPKAAAYEMCEEETRQQMVQILRRGKVERLKGLTSEDGQRNPSVIATGLFSAAEFEKIDSFCNKHRIQTPYNGEIGYIVKPFGKMGKVKIDFQGGGTCSKIGDGIFLMEMN